MVPGDRCAPSVDASKFLFPDGSALDRRRILDHRTSRRPTLLRMTNGRAAVFAAGANNPSSAVQFQIDTPMASATDRRSGRISRLDPWSATASNRDWRSPAARGALVNELRHRCRCERANAACAWDNVAPSRRSSSTPRASTHSINGRWRCAIDVSVHGAVGAVPSRRFAHVRRHAGSLWRVELRSPLRICLVSNRRARLADLYYDGYWSPVPTYGWTWIGANSWSWPTHHYGRWGYAGSRWFWIPDRHWAPAWVSWGGAPGYVSWCPLGFDNRPVFSLVSTGNGYRGWNGWTVVSRDHFRGHRSVRQFAVGPRSLPANVGFVQQASVPVAPPRAVPRRER